MAKQRSLVWRAVDAAERAIAPRSEEAARSGPFLDVVGLAARAQARLRRDVERRSRGVWHLLNLPAASDVTRLRRQVAALDHELRRVSAALERTLAEAQSRHEGDRDAEHPEGGTDRRAARARRSDRPPAARRRAQRASGP
jgi:hypothetical protein